MTTDLWHAPYPTSSLTHGPNLRELTGRLCELAFEGENGERKPEKARLMFRAVEAYKCTYLTSLAAEMIEQAYDRLIDLGTTQWLLQCSDRRRALNERTDRPDVGLKHLMFCFDDGPCYEFICEGFEAMIL